jgi:hypothetical protein
MTQVSHHHAIPGTFMPNGIARAVDLSALIERADSRGEDQASLVSHGGVRVRALGNSRVLRIWITAIVTDPASAGKDPGTAVRRYPPAGSLPYSHYGSERLSLTVSGAGGGRRAQSADLVGTLALGTAVASAP